MTTTEPFVRTGIRARFTNASPHRRREWVKVAVPYRALEGSVPFSFITDRGVRLRAVKFESIGTHSDIWLVFAPFDPVQVVDGEFVADVAVVPNPFTLHPWVGDEPVKLIPLIEIRLRLGQSIVSYRTEFPFPVLGAEPLNSDGGLRFALQTPVGSSGFMMEGWVTFFDNSPVADVRLAVVWSDRTNPALDFYVEGISFFSGEPVVFDFARLNGMTERPVWNGSHWVTQISGPIGFIDGSGLPLIGRMLCLPRDNESVPEYDPSTYSMNDPAANAAQDYETLWAGLSVPVVGVSSAFAGKLLANRNLPRIAMPFAQQQDLARAGALGFFAQFAQPAGSFYNAPRPIGIGKNPGQTGDQQDFGAQKGWEAMVAIEPLWLYQALHSVVADFFRGVMHYEQNGQRLNPDAHPLWRTWSGGTHYSASMSPDRLGKRMPVWGDRTATLHESYDEEHRSQHALAVLYAATGDPILRYIIEHYSTTDVAGVRHRLNFGTGAPRAIGRQLHCWANFLVLFPEGSIVRARFRELIEKAVQVMLDTWYGDKFAGPVDIISDRVDPRMGITWNNEVMSAWSVWEHGLFAVGAYAAWKITKDTRLLDVIRRVCRTVVRYGALKDAQGWTFLSTVHWPKPGLNPTGVPEGQPMPAQFYDRSSTLVQPLNGEVSLWTRNAVLIFIEVVETDDPDLPRARDLLASFASGESSDPRMAEWYACVQSVPPVPGGWRNY